MIPTRNRGHLVRYALKSAQAQRIEGLEVIVSDNDSKDDTSQIVKELMDTRTRYIKTPALFPMPQSWEFALAHARGEWIVLLTDDGYLLPGALDIALEALDATATKAVVWRHAAYFDSRWHEAGRRNIGYIPQTSASVRIFDSPAVLRRPFDWDDSVATQIPKAMNCMVHRSVFEKIGAAQGKVFVGPSPDYTIAVSIMLSIPSYAFIDQVLYVDSVTPESIGASGSFDGGSSNRGFIDEFPRGIEDVTLFGTATATDSIGRSLMNVSALYPGACPPLNHHEQVKKIADSLTKREINGVRNRAEWERLLANCSGSLRWWVPIWRQTYRVKWQLVRLMRKSKTLERLETLRGVAVRRGDREGFSDIEQFASTLASLRSI